MNDTSPTHDRPRTLQSDLEALRSRVEAAISAQPIAATAAAAGIGFVLGSRLARPAMRLLIDVAAGSAATWLGEMIRQTTLAHLEDEEPRANTTDDPSTGGSRS